jgi:hypothetical protein
MKIIVIIGVVILVLACEWRIGGLARLNPVEVKAMQFVLKLLVRVLWVVLVLLVLIGVVGCLDGWGLWSDMADTKRSASMDRPETAGRKEEGTWQGEKRSGGQSMGSNGAAKKKVTIWPTIPGLCLLT